jgi:hypothetical protein
MFFIKKSLLSLLHFEGIKKPLSSTKLVAGLTGQRELRFAQPNTAVAEIFITSSFCGRWQFSNYRSVCN